MELVTAQLTRVRVRIASLKAEDQTYAPVAGSHAANADSGDLSGLLRMTTREAILAVLEEAKPEPVRVGDLDRLLAERARRFKAASRWT